VLVASDTEVPLHLLREYTLQLFYVFIPHVWVSYKLNVFIFFAIISDIKI